MCTNNLTLKNNFMKIETKFNINDLVQFKHTVITEKLISIMEIMEINTQTCYKDTQVFYSCRLLFFENTYKGWESHHGINPNQDMILGWKKYREDELVELSDELKSKIEEIKNN